MKYTIGEMRGLIRSYYEIRNVKAKKLVKEVLNELGGSMEFDWEVRDTPSINSGVFEDDVTDCYITKIYLDHDLVMANLHAYYLNEDADGIDLADEVDTDWVDILDYLVSELEERTSGVVEII